MDWENERYVRLYTRDTVEWEMWRWEARALWPQIMRKLDRSGRLVLGKHGVRGLAALVKLPLEVVQPGLEGDGGLLDDGCVVLEGDVLYAPNFVPAQEAKKSDRQRKAEERERKRAAGQDVTESHEPSEPVTKRDTESRNVTDGHETGQKVTIGHTASQPVTPSLAQPSLAEPKISHSSNSPNGEPDPTERGEPPSLELIPPEADPPGRFGPDALLAMWNEHAHPAMPRAQKLTGSRRRKIETRLREHPDAEWWGEVIDAANASPHCRGESRPQPGAKKPWRCTLDFLVDNDTNAVKLIEGAYGDDRGDPPEPEHEYGRAPMRYFS